ncbi:unnamed protein product, partial [Sphagnum balticum]
MDLKEAYTTLGLAQGASKDEAKKAFKKLAAKHHPDKTDGNEDLFKKINEAYQVIDTGKDFGPTNPNTNPVRGQSGHQYPIDIEDFIRQATGGGPFNPRRRKQIIVEDKVIKDKISFKESIVGCQKEISYKRKIKCTACNGGGYCAKDNGCPNCKGTGVVTSRRGNITMQSSCTACHGQQHFDPCKTCKEEGSVESNVTMAVNIPGGVKEGRDILRLQGVGDYAGSILGGDQYASVHLHLTIEKDPVMRIDEDDVITDCNISLLEALSGCKKQVSSIDVRAKLDDGIERLHARLTKVKGKKSKKKKAEFDGEIIVKEAQKIPGISGIVVTVPLLIS